MDMASHSRLRLPFSLFLISSVFISLVSVSRSFACSLKPSQTLTISHSIKSKPFPQIQSSKLPFLQFETLSKSCICFNLFNQTKPMSFIQTHELHSVLIRKRITSFFFDSSSRGFLLLLFFLLINFYTFCLLIN